MRAFTIRQVGGKASKPLGEAAPVRGRYDWAWMVGALGVIAWLGGPSRRGSLGLVSMTWGKLPSFATFERHFDEELPRGSYNIRLGRSDSKAAQGTSIGDGEYTARELYRGLQELVEKGTDEAGSLASSILETLGFEWV